MEKDEGIENLPVGIIIRESAGGYQSTELLRNPIGAPTSRWVAHPCAIPNPKFPRPADSQPALRPVVPAPTVAESDDYYPFGESNSLSIATQRFTGDDRDTESNLDHTQFRQYSSSLGRWMHPDPAGLAAVDPFNPQSWNRYAYVLNNPKGLLDPAGLNECAPGEHDCNVGESEGNPGENILGGTPPCCIDPLPVLNTAVDNIFSLVPGAILVTVTLNSTTPDTINVPDMVNGSWGPNGPLHSGGSSWAWTFTKSFFTFAGGPGNVPTCAGQALRDIADDVLNPVPTDVGPAEAAKLAATYGAAVQFNRTLAYAAGKGLTSPWKSTVFQEMLEGSKSLAEETGAGSIAVATSFSAAYRTYTTSAAARNGECSAAFPIF